MRVERGGRTTHEVSQEKHPVRLRGAVKHSLTPVLPLTHGYGNERSEGAGGGRERVGGMEDNKKQEEEKEEEGREQ